MPAFGVARATPQFLGRDVPLGASSRGSCGASWRGWGLWAGAGAAGEGEPRASLALRLRGPDSALSSSPTPRGTGTSGDGSWRWSGHASCARTCQCPPGHGSAPGRVLGPGRAVGPGRVVRWHRPCCGHLAAGQRCPSEQGPQSGTRHCQQAACCLLDSEIWPQLARIQFNYDKQRLHPLSRD